MSSKRISAFLLCLVMVFTLIGQFATPVSAVKAKDIGITVKGEKYYNYDKDCYAIKMTVNLSNEEKYHPIDDPVLKAYLYNEKGDCVMKWTNSGKGYLADKESQTMTFNIDAKKLKAGKYTFKYYVSCEYFDEHWNSVDQSFYWSYTLDRANMIQSLKFKQMSYTTDSNGKTLPRVNLSYRNLKDQTLTIRYYDKYDNIIHSQTSSPKKDGFYSTWFVWDGKDNGSQYPDGNYKVKITSSGGLSITETFYFDFPGYKK